MSDEQRRAACGIIMPIAAMPGYDADHWATVLELVTRAVEAADLKAVPVWSGGATDVLHERIVRNLYEQPIAVCDVSGLNPNVMLELGIRLAFGKPTVIINDEGVRAPFDICSIEYIACARDLQVSRAEDFVRRLTERLRAVQEKSAAGSYRPFIKTFCPIDPGAPGDEAVPIGRAVLDQLEQLAAAVRGLQDDRSIVVPWAVPASTMSLRVPTGCQGFAVPASRQDGLLTTVAGLSGVISAELVHDDGAPRWLPSGTGPRPRRFGTA